MKVLITGGTGFIGSYVTRLLVAEGHDVVCYDQQPDGNAFEKVLDADSRRSVTVVQGDVTDAVSMLRVLGQHRIETVIHLASLLVPSSDADPRRALYVNSGSLVDILEAARILGLRRVVWASSVAVFGDRSMYGDEPIPDDAPHGPSSVYGATKSLNEFMARLYFDKFGVDSIGLRFTIVYGHARLRGASAFATQLLRNPALNLPGVVEYADARMDWQYVEDAALATVMAARKEGPTRTRTFNTGGIVATPGEVAALVRELIPSAELTLRSGKLSGLDSPDFDVSGAERELGFRPRYTVRAGVIKTINDIRVEAGLAPLVAS